MSSKRGKILENEARPLGSNRRLMGRTDLVLALSECIGPGWLAYLDRATGETRQIIQKLMFLSMVIVESASWQTKFVIPRNYRIGSRPDENFSSFVFPRSRRTGQAYELEMLPSVV